MTENAGMLSAALCLQTSGMGLQGGIIFLCSSTGTQVANNITATWTVGKVPVHCKGKDGGCNSVGEILQHASPN